MKLTNPKTMNNFKIGDKVRIEGEIVKTNEGPYSYLISVPSSYIAFKEIDLQLIEEEKGNYKADSGENTHCLKCDNRYCGCPERQNDGSWKDSPKLPKNEFQIPIVDISSEPYLNESYLNIKLEDAQFKSLVEQVVEKLNNQNNA